MTRRIMTLVAVAAMVVLMAAVPATAFAQSQGCPGPPTAQGCGGTSTENAGQGVTLSGGSGGSDQGGGGGGHLRGPLFALNGGQGGGGSANGGSSDGFHGGGCMTDPSTGKRSCGPFSF